MTQVIQQVNINLIPQVFGANSVLVPCSQYDKTYRVIQFNVYNGRELYSIPSTCTVIIRGTKKDNTGFEYNCEFSGSQVIFPLEPQITVLSGKVPAELRIVNGEELIGSANFLFMVEPSPLTDDTIISETQLPLLEEALQAAAEAEQSRILAETAKDAAEDYAMSAGESAQSASQSAVNASISEANALTSEQNAKASEQNAKESEDLAKGYSEDAQGYASNASDSATSAEASATRAEEAVEDIEAYVTEAQGYAEQSFNNAHDSSVSASNALTSENNAHTSELNAKASEDNAKQSETNASASATASANSASQASTSASNASQSATNSANSATASANSATASADSATQASQSATSAEESATEAQVILDNIDSLIEHKADDDGIYPNMSVGSSERLMTSETVDDQFTYQTLNHDGYARINSIKGNTIVWNQLQNTTVSRTLNGVTYTSLGNGKLKISGTATADSYWLGSADGTKLNVIAGHKYLFILGNPSYTGSARTYDWYITPAYKQFLNNVEIWQATVTREEKLNFVVVNGQTIDMEFTPQIFDLTPMSYDSLTADQFRSLYPLNYYQYNSGELLSFNGSGIKTVGFNLWDEEYEEGEINASTGDNQTSANYWRTKNYIPVLPYTVYYDAIVGISTSYGFRVRFYDADKNYVGYRDASGNQVSTNSTFRTPSNVYYMRFALQKSQIPMGTNICINLSSSKNGTSAPYSTNTLELPISQYFPNGMRSAGSVYDELVPKKKKAITRVGAVDLGTLGWVISGGTTPQRFQATMPSNYRAPANASERLRLACSKYVATNDVLGQNETTGIGNYQNLKTIFIRDLSYSTASDLKASLSGVMLNYEIENPTEVDITEDLLQYKVESGGTEQLLPINTDVPVTSPLSRNVSFYYDSNVVSNLLTLLSSVAQVETSPTTHAYSVGDYLMYNYQLYRVTSAIAVGANLTVGTNIVATTLVAIINS